MTEKKKKKKEGGEAKFSETETVFNIPIRVVEEQCLVFFPFVLSGTK
jgi:hypothetical protein